MDQLVWEIAKIFKQELVRKSWFFKFYPKDSNSWNKQIEEKSFSIDDNKKFFLKYINILLAEVLLKQALANRIEKCILFIFLLKLNLGSRYFYLILNISRKKLLDLSLDFLKTFWRFWEKLSLNWMVVWSYIISILAFKWGCFLMLILLMKISEVKSDFNLIILHQFLLYTSKLCLLISMYPIKSKTFFEDMEGSLEKCLLWLISLIFLYLLNYSYFY